MSYGFLGREKKSTFCDFNVKLKMYWREKKTSLAIICEFVCVCLCTLTASVSFRKAGHRAMSLQLPPLCALFDGEEDAVDFCTNTHTHTRAHTVYMWQCTVYTSFCSIRRACCSSVHPRFMGVTSSYVPRPKPLEV